MVGNVQSFAERGELLPALLASSAYDFNSTVRLIRYCAGSSSKLFLGTGRLFDGSFSREM